MTDRRILKYVLWCVEAPSFDEFMEIDAPPSIGINHIAKEGRHLHLWSLVELNHKPIKRRFRIVATGQSTEPTGNYLGTVHERSFVWHVFEVFLGGNHD